MPLQRDSCLGCLDWLLIVLGIFPRFGQVITLSRCCALLLLLFCRPARYHPSTTHHRHSQIGSGRCACNPLTFGGKRQSCDQAISASRTSWHNFFFFLFWTAQKAKPPPAARPTRRLAAQPPLSSFTWCRCCLRCCCCCCLMLLLFA